MTDTHKFTPGPDTREHFRAAMGRFATGVAVITTQSDIGPLGDDGQFVHVDFDGSAVGDVGTGRRVTPP